MALPLETQPHRRFATLSVGDFEADVKPVAGRIEPRRDGCMAPLLEASKAADPARRASKVSEEVAAIDEAKAVLPAPRRPAARLSLLSSVCASRVTEISFRCGIDPITRLRLNALKHLRHFSEPVVPRSDARRSHLAPRCRRIVD